LPPFLSTLKVWASLPPPPPLSIPLLKLGTRLIYPLLNHYIWRRVCKVLPSFGICRCHHHHPRPWSSCAISKRRLIILRMLLMLLNINCVPLNMININMISRMAASKYIFPPNQSLFESQDEKV
jgi:hypothetical protein